MSRNLFTSVSMGGGGGIGSLEFQDYDGTKHGPFRNVNGLVLKSGKDSCLKFSTEKQGGKLVVSVSVYYS